MRKWVRRWSWLLQLLVGAGLLGLLVRRYPITLDSVLRSLAAIEAGALLLALGLLFNQNVLSAFKWRLILVSHGIELPLVVLIRTYMIGRFFGSFMPSSYGGDLVRIADVARRTGRSFESASSVVLERLSGLTALAAAGAMASAYLAWRLADPALARASALFLALLCLLVGIFVPGASSLGRSLSERVPMQGFRRLAGKILDTVGFYGRKPRLLASILACSIGRRRPTWPSTR